MIRRAWPLALALAALVGCGETPPPDESGAPLRGVAPGEGGGNEAGGGGGPAPAGDLKSQGYPGMDPSKGGAGEPGKPEAPPAGTEAPKETAEPPKKGTEAAKPEAAATVQLSEKEIANIKQLPAEEAELALKQKICPISEGHLGDENMGTPIKVVADGKTAFLCCGGCKRDFEKDPKAALAKLGLDK